MDVIQLINLSAIFLTISIISAIAGSTSLLTVPVMFQFGIEPRTALATNIFALTLMSIGSTIPFIGKGVINRCRLPFLIFLTLASSILGALLVLIVPSKSMPLIISISMILVTVFSIANRDAGIVPTVGVPSQIAEFAGYTQYSRTWARKRYLVTYGRLHAEVKAWQSKSTSLVNGATTSFCCST